MSIDYTAILAVGKEFEGVGETERFLREHGLLADVSEEDVERRGLDDYVPEDMTCECLNYMTGWGYYIGYKIRCGSPEEFRNDFEAGVAKWNRRFRDVPAEIIHTVQVS